MGEKEAVSVVVEALRERLDKHNENRKSVQEDLELTCDKLIKHIDELERETSRKLEEEFVKESSRLQSAMDDIYQSRGYHKKLQKAIQKAGVVLDTKLSCFVKKEYSTDFMGLINLGIKSEEVAHAIVNDKDEVIEALNRRFDEINENRKEVQEKLRSMCEEWRKEIGELKRKINNELEGPFKKEDGRLQNALGSLNDSTASETLQKAKAELVVVQKYSLNKNGEAANTSGRLMLVIEKEVVFEYLNSAKPKALKISKISGGRIFFDFTFLNREEKRVLKENGLSEKITYNALLQKKSCEDGGKEYSLRKEEKCFSFIPEFLEAGTVYSVKMKVTFQGKESKWSEAAEFTTPKFSEYCVWKECSDDVNKDRKYSVDEINPRIATGISIINLLSSGPCTVIGNMPLPQNKVTSWNIKILKSNDNNGCGIGVTPTDISQNENHNQSKCGWYFYCYDSTLWSSPPHSYECKKYGPRKEEGDYVHEGDSVGVVMDTTKGELSFVVNGVNFGVAYDGIPLDKPLVPCVLLLFEGDSVELETTEVKENVNSSISVPSNITAKSATWDSITLSWNAVEGASFYQIEADGSKFWDASTTNTFTKRGLQLGTEHSFRVRAVCGNKVSEWSGAVKGRTQEALDFSKCAWKECPDDIYEERKYSVDEKNPRIATKIGYGHCSTIIGNTPLPHNKVTSWSIKILKSKDNDGEGILVGVAPFNIDQNEEDNECGWYFHCYNSTLYSGQPHNYEDKEYGPRNENGGYVHTGDSVGVVMDTAKGELSFVMNCVNLGVAYDGIPLDKPLVPCVVLWYENEGDSVNLII